MDRSQGRDVRACTRTRNALIECEYDYEYEYHFIEYEFGPGMRNFKTEAVNMFTCPAAGRTVRLWRGSTSSLRGSQTTADSIISMTHVLTSRSALAGSTSAVGYWRKVRLKLAACSNLSCSHKSDSAKSGDRRE